MNENADVVDDDDDSVTKEKVKLKVFHRVFETTNNSILIFFASQISYQRSLTINFLKLLTLKMNLKRFE